MSDDMNDDMSEEMDDDSDESDDGSGPRDDADVARSDGVSLVASAADPQFDGTKRPIDWQGRVYGLVVHSTGSSLPAGARAQGVAQITHAVDWYVNRRPGTHYVNGWLGVDGGELVQVANEHVQVPGVGVTNAKEPDKDQRLSIEAGRFESDLPPVMVRLWRARWPGVADSLALLPHTRTANSCYVHVECIPCVFHSPDELITGEGVEPMRPGLRYTTAQHDAVIALAVDVASRNGWPLDETWWRTPRLLGHEDLTPISRFVSSGGWDPGALRDDPWFDWEYVYEGIANSGTTNPIDAIVDGATALTDLLAALGGRVGELVQMGQERQAVSEAITAGVTDLNELTNLIFFARHPELDGRPIEAGERELAAEWIDIRDTVVRPTLEEQGG